MAGAGTNLFADESIGFAEDMATLRVTQDDPVATTVLNHLRAQLTYKPDHPIMEEHHRHHFKKLTAWWYVPRALFVWLRLLGAAKNTVWKATANSRLKTKQAGQQDRWLTNKRLTGLPNLFQACLLCFVPDTSALMHHKLKCFEQPTFLRYLWTTHSKSVGNSLNTNIYS